ncbi:hypothetical protein FSP39_024977 [Pinctada imbricata]|uniref:Amino acid transporter n=1 Tax=Pinctada imbricata TaxID=66713 RepID=A0AA88YPY3_PINIB|nr:hypothetical protein FSP39_024977 [Pinctada imbricata]
MASRKCLKRLRSNALIICTFVGVGLGFGLGFGIREVDPNADTLIWLGTPGDIYMRLLKMTILPLVVSSIIVGTSSLDPKSSGRLGGLAIMLIVITNALGSLLAILLFFIFRPGIIMYLSYILKIVQGGSSCMRRHVFLFHHLALNLFPDNVVTACFQKVQTRYTTSEIIQERNRTNITILEYNRYQGTSGGVNIIGLIIICSIFGIAASRTPEEIRKPFVDLFNSMSEITITVLHWIVWITPLGVASLIAASIAGVDDVKDIFERVGMFIFAYTLGIVIHQVILVPLVYFIAVRKNPFKYIASCARPWMTAFAPPSTAIAMPEMMNTLERKNDIDRRITRFSVPFGAALMRLGSCLFICLSALFLMVLEGKQITAIRVLLAGVLTTVGSLAIPSVPSASIITVLVVMSLFNVQSLNIGLLMALEWYSDRLRTTSNTMTVMLSSVLLQRLCKFDDETDTGNQVDKVDKRTYEKPTEQSSLTRAESETIKRQNIEHEYKQKHKRETEHKYKQKHKRETEHKYKQKHKRETEHKYKQKHKRETEHKYKQKHKRETEHKYKQKHKRQTEHKYKQKHKRQTEHKYKQKHKRQTEHKYKQKHKRQTEHKYKQKHKRQTEHKYKQKHKRQTEHKYKQKHKRQTEHKYKQKHKRETEHEYKQKHKRETEHKYKQKHKRETEHKCKQKQKHKQKHKRETEHKYKQKHKRQTEHKYKQKHKRETEHKYK